MLRAQKQQSVEALHKSLQDASLVVVASHNGLTVADVTDLRKKMRAEGASFRVTKNTLATLALKDTEHEGITESFKGPTSVAMSQDPVAAARIIVDFAKDHKEKVGVVAASLNGRVLDVAGVKELASLPSLDALRGKLIGLLQAPATKVAGVTQAPASQIARVISAYGAQGS